MFRKIVTSTVWILMLVLGFAIGRISDTGEKEATKQEVWNTNKRTSTEPEVVVSVDTIAVVNLDEGVIQDGQHIYYSHALVEFPSDKFVYAGLEEARTGTVSDIYAAYIVIPASFSEDIQSLNTVMSKSQITYETNSLLEEDTRGETLSSIHTFVQSMADNVSYLYVSSIIGEFHEAQDNAVQVMENDREDTAVILAIRPFDLQSYVEYPNLMQADMSSEVLDIQNYITQNGELIAQIQSQYEAGATGSEADKTLLIDAGSSVGTSLQATNIQLQNLDLTKSGTGDPVYDSGLANVSSAASGYNEALDRYNEALATYNSTLEKNRVHIQDAVDRAEDNLTSLEQYWNEITDGIEDYNKMISGIEAYNVTEIPEAAGALADRISSGSYTITPSSIYRADPIAGTVELPGVGTYQLLSVVTDDVTGEETVELNDVELQNFLDAYTEKLITDNMIDYTYISADGNRNSINDLNSLRDTINDSIPKCDPANFSQVPDANENNIGEDITMNQTEIAALFSESKELLGFNTAADGDYPIGQMDKKNLPDPIKTDNLLEAVTTDVVTPLLNRTEEVKETFNTQYTATSNRLATYQDSLSVYDAASYINQASIQQSYAGMQENGVDMQTGIQAHDTSQSETMIKTYATYSENQTILMQHIEEVQKASDEAVASGLSQAQQVKEKSSSSNQTLMKTFVEKLPYTRLGTGENVAANKFIVNPLRVSEQVSTETIESDESPVEQSSVGVTGGSDSESSPPRYQMILPIAAAAILIILTVVIFAVQVVRKKRER